jgi:hypothetical protein
LVLEVDVADNFDANDSPDTASDNAWENYS